MTALTPQELMKLAGGHVPPVIRRWAKYWTQRDEISGRYRWEDQRPQAKQTPRERFMALPKVMEKC